MLRGTIVDFLAMSVFSTSAMIGCHCRWRRHYSAPNGNLIHIINAEAPVKMFFLIIGNLSSILNLAVIAL